MVAIEIIILAAGQGSRMRSSKPKVLHQIGGKPMLQHVIDGAKSLNPQKIHVVIGHGADQVQNTISETNINWVEQKEQLGTGHAVAQVLPHLGNDSKVLILYGDVPLTPAPLFENLVTSVSDNSMALLTIALDDPTGYGRIERNTNNDVIAIVEHKDASDEQLQIKEINTGIMAATSSQLASWLPQLSSANAQGEYYLTDIIAMAVSENKKVLAKQAEAEWQVQGVNNRLQLAQLERRFQAIQADELMTNGATLADPARVDVRGEISVGNDVFIDINAVFTGRVVIGNNVSIGPNCVISDSEIGDNTEIKANTILEETKVGRACVIGPFARLRPATELVDGAKIGNFVETKKSKIGKGSKVNHLSYIGDSTIGENTNIGAGTITCNYDGVNKHQTIIGDEVFIGSNTSLVAPIKIDDGATVGAGSTVTMAVEQNELAVARGKQRNIPNWQRPVKREK